MLLRGLIEELCVIYGPFHSITKTDYNEMVDKEEDRRGNFQN